MSLTAWVLLLLLQCTTGARQLQQDFARVALCLAVRDERREDLREWVRYHLAIGVQRFFIWDNNSTVPLAPFLTPWLQSGTVEYHYIASTGPAPPQFHIYNRCLEQYRHKAQFIGFIDTDEYIVIPGGENIVDVLMPYAGFGGLAINWRMVGPSGQHTRPSAGILASYTRCLPEDHENNAHVKTIAVALHTHSCNGAHAFIYEPGYTAVNVRRQHVPHAFSAPPDWSKIYLYHYVTKSRQDWHDKVARGAGDGTRKPTNYYEYVDRQSTADCLALRKYAGLVQNSAVVSPL